MKSKYHILIAEDEKRMLRTMIMILKSEKYMVTGAGNGREALEKIKEAEKSGRPFDLLITDIQMPVFTGKELIEELKRQNIELQVLAITGYGDKEMVVDLMRLGIRDYIDKPFTMDALSYRVRIIINNIIAQRERMQHTEKMATIGVFASEIAHDFNNILGAASGYTELAREKVDGENPVCRDLDKIKSATTRAAKLSHQLLTFSSKNSVESVPLNLNQSVRDMIDMLNCTVAKSAKIHIELADDLSVILANQGEIEQVIMNLAVNARDAMPNGGTLTIKTENIIINEDSGHDIPNARTGDFIRLIVSDTGTGMDEETLRQIFKTFFTTKEKGKGTGLGLAVVQRIVSEHDGWIDVASRPGSGSTFTVYLPVLQTETVPAKSN